MRAFLMTTLLLLAANFAPAQNEPFVLRDDIKIPELPGFTPLPDVDAELSERLREIVEAVGLDNRVAAADSPMGRDEQASIYLVDLSDINNPRTAGWNHEQLTYPASTYKMYVAAEAIRQVVEGERSLDDVKLVAEHNVRGGSRPVPGQEMTLSETIRLTMQYSDNTTANELIDIVDRQRASALMRALGCEGSEITRKFLGRNLEDEGYANVVGTATSGLHAGTFLWAVETGAIGGGKGRGLIKGYAAMNDRGRFYRGLPDSATIHSKTGWWNIYTSEAAIIEDGGLRYILCAFTVQTTSEAEPRMAELAARVHAMLGEANETE